MNAPNVIFWGFKIVWVCICLAVLVISGASFYSSPNHDSEVFLVSVMLVLAFPISFLYALLFAGIARAYFFLTGEIIPSTFITICINWLGFFLLGYIQWFQVAPWLLRKLKKM